MHCSTVGWHSTLFRCCFGICNWRLNRRIGAPHVTNSQYLLSTLRGHPEQCTEQQAQQVRQHGSCELSNTRGLYVASTSIKIFNIASCTVIVRTTDTPRELAMGRYQQLLLLVSIGAAAGQPDPYNCSSQPNGTFDPIILKGGGVTLSLIRYGATATSLLIADRNGVARDILLGFDDATQYCKNSQHPYFGATIGRVSCNR